MQFDLWGVTPTDLHDWASLKADIAKHGVRNSLLLAPMPTASTAQILGNNESIEPYTSNIYSRRVLSGEFQVRIWMKTYRYTLKLDWMGICFLWEAAVTLSVGSKWGQPLKGCWPYFGPDIIHYVFYSRWKGIIRTVELSWKYTAVLFLECIVHTKSDHTGN